MQEVTFSSRIASLFGAVAITAFMLTAYFMPPASAATSLLA